MCTVTIIPLVDSSGELVGLRLATNRDESRRRPPAEPPRYHERAGLRGIWPIDPAGGGTWVGVNESGLVTTLLNRNDGSPRPTRAARSRGEIVPMLLEQRDVSGAARILAQISAAEFLPFTIVATDGRTLLHGAADGGAVRISKEAHGLKPLMFTSSGLGDALVEPPRRRLFDGWFGDDPNEWKRLQDAFHRHRWPDATHLSVCMCRDDARTVSLTTIEVGPSIAQMSYCGYSHDESGDSLNYELPLHGAAR